MSKANSHHVVPSPNGGWSVLKAGAQRASRRFLSKREAVDWGRTVSRSHGTELFIHREDGTVQEKSSYAADPLPPRDSDTP